MSIEQRQAFMQDFEKHVIDQINFKMLKSISQNVLNVQNMI